ncbi:hypothetical protein BH11BAC5_BH11BAC5_31730 [soil metagenome]|jgi:hypothetical protein
MGLALDLFLTILLELPIIALFFKRKKRPDALMNALMVNLISWPVAHILKISTDISIYLIEAIVIAGEGIALWLLTGCGWKKGLIMSVIANLISFAATSLIHIEPDILQGKPQMIIH